MSFVAPHLNSTSVNPNLALYSFAIWTEGCKYSYPLTLQPYLAIDKPVRPTPEPRSATVIPDLSSSISSISLFKLACDKLVPLPLKLATTCWLEC